MSGTVVLLRNDSGFPLDAASESAICLSAARTVENEGVYNRSVSVTIAEPEVLRALNKRYRGLDKPTDVLSFPTGDELLGDIVINIRAAISQANEYGHGLRRELAFLTAHSALHLLGYDHADSEDERVMSEKQELALQQLGIIRE